MSTPEIGHMELNEASTRPNRSTSPAQLAVRAAQGGATAGIHPGFHGNSG